jgi:hypothetical protein
MGMQAVIALGFGAFFVSSLAIGIRLGCGWRAATAASRSS